MPSVAKEQTRIPPGPVGLDDRGEGQFLVPATAGRGRRRPIPPEEKAIVTAAPELADCVAV